MSQPVARQAMQWADLSIEQHVELDFAGKVVIAQRRKAATPGDIGY